MEEHAINFIDVRCVESRNTNKNKMKKQKQQPRPERARDTFLKWCKSTGNKEDAFKLYQSGEVFVAIRIPNHFAWTWSYKGKSKKK